VWERWLRASAEINSRLVSGACVADVLRLIAEQARQLSTSDCVLIVLADPARAGQSIVRAAAGQCGEWTVGSVFPDLDEDGFGPALTVPIGSANQLDGALIALRAKPFTDEELAMFAAFADQAALAERDRAAGALHDHLIQRLFATGMTLQGGARRIADEDTRRRVQRAVEELDETIRELRNSLQTREPSSRDR
jgi:two-component system, NarL family, sensor histidine kinase DevS